MNTTYGSGEVNSAHPERDERTQGNGGRDLGVEAQR